MNIDTLIYSKHFLYKSTLFSTTKRLLTIGFSSLILDSIPASPSSFELIELSDIQILPSPKSPKDLSLCYIKKSQTNTLEISSNNRPLLLIELYKAEDLYNTWKKPSKGLKELFGGLIFCEKDLEPVKLLLTRTCLKGVFIRRPPEDPGLLEEFLDIHVPVIEPKEIKNKGDFIDFIINLNEISKIIKEEQGFTLILKENHLFYRFIFQEEETSKIQEFLDLIKENFKQFCKGFDSIDFIEKNLEEDLSYKTLDNLILKERVCRISLSKAKKETIFFGFNEEFLFEISLETGNLLNKIPISSLQNFIRIDFPESTGFQLLFTDNRVREYHLDGILRDNILSSLLYCFSQKESDPMRKDLFPRGRTPLKEPKIQGFLNNEPDCDYELDLLNRILNPKREENFLEVLKELTKNLSLKKTIYQDNKALICLIEKTLSFIGVYKGKEFQELVEAFTEASLYHNIESSDRSDSRLLNALETSITKAEILKNRLPIKINAMVLDLASFGQICLYLEECLRGLVILITNKGYFKEFSMNKKEILYEKLLIAIMELTLTKNPVISYYCLVFLKYLSHLPYNSYEIKAECLNKYWLFNTETINIYPKMVNLVEELLYKPNKHTLSLFALLNLLKHWIIDKKETISTEDKEKLISLLKTLNFLSLLIKSLEPDNLTTFPLITSLLSLLIEIEPSQKQKFLFEHSVILFTYLRAFFLLKFSNLKALSIKFLSNLLYDNGDACSLMLRLFPRNLFLLCKGAPKDLSKWDFLLWDQFFEVLSKDYRTAGEIWDDVTRKEFIEQAKEVEIGFELEWNRLVKKTTINNEKNENENEIKDFNNQQMLYFNYREFFLDYTSLEPYCLIGRYYLVLLIQESDSEKPLLTSEISQIYRFFTELIFSYLSKEEFNDKILILKVLILIMREKSDEIKEFTAIGYFLNLLIEERDHDIKLLIMQLLYMSLKGENQRNNRVRFLKEQGVDKLFFVLSKLIGFSFIPYESTEEIPINDFTDSTLYESPLRTLKEKVLSCSLFLLETLKTLLNNNSFDEKTPFIYPLKGIKSLLKNPLYIEILCNCLIIEGDIRISTLSLWIIKEGIEIEGLLGFKGVEDFLMYCLSPETHNLVIDILDRMKTWVLGDNLQINYLKMYTQFSFEELNEPTVKKALYFFPFLKFLPKGLANKLFFGQKQEFLEVFYAEKYEAPDLIWGSTMRLFLKRSLKEHFKSLNLAYTNYSLQKHPNTIQEIENPFEIQNSIEIQIIERSNSFLNTKGNFIENINTKEKSFVKLKSLCNGIPQYISTINSVFTYESLYKEVCCGPLYLRIWNKKGFREFPLEKTEIDRFLTLLQEKMDVFLKDNIESFTEELLQIVTALSKAIKRYKVKDYRSFEEIFLVLTSFAKGFQRNPRLIIVAIRSIYRVISIENSSNINNFLKKNGISVILSLFHTETLFSISKATPPIESVKILCLIIKIISFFLTKAPEVLKGLLEKDLKSLFNLLGVLGFILDGFLTLLGENLPLKEAFNELKDGFTSLLKGIVLEPQFIYFLIEANLGFFAIKECLLSRKTPTNKEIEGFCLNMGIFLKNLNIWCYESYVLVNNGGPKKLEIGSKLSSKVFLSIHRLSNKEKEALSDFYEVCYNLLQRDNLMNLLRVYQDPNEEKTDGLNEFLSVLNGDNRDLKFFWNGEVREDLNEVIKRIIEGMVYQFIKENQEESILELGLVRENNLFNIKELKEYRYALHLKELTLEDIYIGVFNEGNEITRLPNFGYFLKLLFTSIKENWVKIEQNIPFPEYLTNKTRLKSPEIIYFYQIKQGIQAISLILTREPLDNLYLEKNHFKVLITSWSNSLNISSYFAQEDLLLIQKDCLSIFSHLTRQKEAIISLLTNKTGMLCLIKGFIGIFPLKEKIFDILTNISLEKHLFSFLTHFGFPFYFFEVILAKELYPMELRVKSFDFLLQSISEKKEIATFFLFNLPESLKAAFYKGNNAFIQALDQEKVLLKEMWTPRMRKELFIKAKIFNETLIQEIMAYKGDYVPLETSLVNDEGYSILKPLFPELKEEIIIDGIFLRSLVKGLGAGFDGVGFLNRVLDEGEAIFNDFTNGFSKEIEGFNRVMNELLLFLSVVILLLEQELYKEEKSFKGKGLNRFIGLLDIKGLNTHVRCSLEQIVLLGLEMGLLEEKPLVEITCRLLKELIAGKEDNNNNLDFSKRLSFVFILFPFIVEEIVLLHILLKSILKERKGLSIVVEIGLECLLWFLEEGENKAYLDDIIMNILGFLVKDLEYGEPTIEILSKKPYINIENNFEKIKPRDFDFKRLWRGFSNDYDPKSHLERTFSYYSSENEVLGFNLPVISELTLGQLPLYNKEVKKEIAQIEEFIMKEVFEAKEMLKNN